MDCVRLLTGGAADDELVLALGGAHARALLATEPLETQDYWLRVWAARGLMWEWDDMATEASARHSVMMPGECAKWHAKSFSRNHLATPCQWWLL